MRKLFLVLAALFLVQSMAYAEEGKEKGKRFEENKLRVLENLGKRIGFLNKFKSCVTSSGSRQELKSCRMTNKKNMEAFRADRAASKEERKKLRTARKEEREKRRAARKERRK